MVIILIYISIIQHSVIAILKEVYLIWIQHWKNDMEKFM